MFNYPRYRPQLLGYFPTIAPWSLFKQYSNFVSNLCMYHNANELLNKRLARYISVIEKHLKQRLAIARNREYVADEIKNEMDVMEALMTATPRAKEFTEDFVAQYEQGVAVASIMDGLKRRYGSNEALFSRHIDASKPLVSIADDDNERIAALVSNDRSLMKYMVQFITLQQLKRRLSDLLLTDITDTKTNSSNSYPVEWTANKDNKTEFVQLIYALHSAGYLNNGKGEITKIVESLAGTLGVTLGKNWQSNLSASIHRSNSDYQPAIFGKISAAYAEYAERLITAKQNNR